MDDKGKKMIDAILPTGAATPPKKEEPKRDKKDTSGKKQIVNKRALKWIFKDEDMHPSYSDNLPRGIRNMVRFVLRGVLILGVAFVVTFIAIKSGELLTWVRSWR